MYSQLILLSLSVWASNALTTSSSRTNCEAIKDRFRWLSSTLCPLEVVDECYDQLIFDPAGAIKFHCHNAYPDYIDEKEDIWVSNASSFLKIVHNTPSNPLHLNWCMISFFYAPNSEFSVKFAPFFNTIPSNFAPIKAVAVDVSVFSRLNTRYGVSGTPTVLLWLNGNAVARMDLSDLTQVGLRKFIEQWSNLSSRRIFETLEGPLQIDFKQADRAQTILLALFIVFISIGYLLRERILDRPDIQLTLMKIGLNSEHIKQYMSHM